MPSSNYSNEKQYVLFHLSAALPQAQKHLDESFSLLASGGSPADGFPQTEVLTLSTGAQSEGLHPCTDLKF
jgi:hypothetical protein